MTGTQREDKKLTEFGLAETLIAIHVEEARCELRKMRLQADVEVSSVDFSIYICPTCRGELERGLL